MPSLDLTSVLTQIPIVVIFIWFILERDKRQSANEEKRDQKQREFAEFQHTRANEFMERVADKLDTLTVKTEAHDARSVMVIQQVAETLARVMPEHNE